ncbi:MAG TPA: NfeD family protein [Nocardioidaceae bacterium]|nr:NfeD family protein [Nocardioidaceae bacterium]
MDWSPEAWHVWLGIAAVLVVAEMFSLDLILLMLGAGAIVGAVLGMLDAPFPVQALAAGATALGMLTLVRPSMVRRLHSGPELRHGPAALIGSSGYVLEEVSAQGGLIKVAGETWTARPYDETAVIPSGAKIEVYEIRGATAYVAQVAELES